MSCERIDNASCSWCFWWQYALSWHQLSCCMSSEEQSTVQWASAAWLLLLVACCRMGGQWAVSSDRPPGGAPGCWARPYHCLPGHFRSDLRLKLSLLQARSIDVGSNGMMLPALCMHNRWTVTAWHQTTRQACSVRTSTIHAKICINISCYCERPCIPASSLWFRL